LTATIERALTTRGTPIGNPNEDWIVGHFVAVTLNPTA
jgi:hypothetical protein